MATTYYSVPGGGYAFTDQPRSPLPPGWAVITLAAYTAGDAGVTAANDAAKAAQVLADCMARKTAYNELVATAVLSDATCHLLSGWDHGDC